MELDQIHVDPEELRKFADALAQFGQHVHDFDGRLAGQLDRLGDTFRDRDYVKFREAFVKSRMQLKLFIEEARKVVPELKKDAEIIVQSQKVKLQI